MDTIYKGKEYSLLFWSSTFFNVHVFILSLFVVNPGILQGAYVVNSEAILYSISST